MKCAVEEIRALCENIFDEMKKRYGWGGFVTQDIERTASS